MKKHLLSLPVFVALLMLSLISCNPDNEQPSDNTNYDTEASVQSQDQSNFSTQVDAVTNDANIILEASSGFAGRLVFVTPATRLTPCPTHAPSLSFITVLIAWVHIHEPEQ